MVCRYRAAAFGNYVGVRYAVLVGCIYHSVNSVVHILLNGVVHTALAARRACTVVINSQAATYVGELHLEAHFVQLNIELRCFAQGGFYVAYLGYLAAYVEMYEAQAVAYVVLVEQFQRLEQFARCEAKLACIAAALFPFAAAFRRQFYAYAYVGAHTKPLANLGNALELVEFLCHEEYATPHLLCQKGHFYVAVVFVTVADDERVAVGVHCDNLVQLGF